MGIVIQLDHDYVSTAIFFIRKSSEAYQSVIACLKNNSWNALLQCESVTSVSVQKRASAKHIWYSRKPLVHLFWFGLR